MNIRDEIDKYSLPEEREMMHWLFDRYHTSMTWPTVAYCVFVRYGHQSYQAYKCWRPNPRGRREFMHSKLVEALRFYADQENWEEINSGIGSFPGPAIDYGAAAREVLAELDSEPLPNPESPWVYDKEKKRYVNTTEQ